MKIEFHLKDPDGFSEGIREHIGERIAALVQIEGMQGFTEKVLDTMREEMEESIQDALEPWVEFSEYVTLEYDTDTKQLTVKKK